MEKHTEPNIVFINEDVVILEKPAGWVTHPSREGETGTLSEWVIARFPEIVSVGENPLRPGIVHRLDKDASGLLAIARNQESFEHLKKQFQEHRIKKEYLCLVHGKLSSVEGVIDRPIARSQRGHRMAARPKNQEGRSAVTEYVVERLLGGTAGPKHGYTLLRVTTHTGRTHQVRAHMQSMGHPIVGDRLYRLRKQRKVDTELGRIFLHAHRLGFFDRRGVWREYESALSPELSQYLSEIPLAR